MRIIEIKPPIMSLLLIILIPVLLLSCKDTNPPIRFITDSVNYPESSFIEISDGYLIDVECVKIDAKGNATSLWEESLETYDGGLGNIIFILTEPNLKVILTGQKRRVRDFPDVKSENIAMSTRGRNASINPSCVMWYCVITDASTFPADSFLTMPANTDAIVASCIEEKCEAIVLLGKVR